MHIPKPLASPQVLTNSAKSALLAQKSTLFMEKLLQYVDSGRSRAAGGSLCFPTFYYLKLNLGIKLSWWSFVYIKEVDIKKALSVLLPCSIPGGSCKTKSSCSRGG